MFLAFAMWTLTTALFQTRHDVVAAKATMGILFAFYLFYDMAYTPMLVGTQCSSFLLPNSPVISFVLSLYP